MALYSVRYTYNPSDTTWERLRKTDRRTAIISSDNDTSAREVASSYVATIARHEHKRAAFIHEVVPIISAA